jgi:hypothetical protein
VPLRFARMVPGQFIDGQVLESGNKTGIDTQRSFKFRTRARDVTPSAERDAHQVVGLEVFRFYRQHLPQESNALVPLLLPDQGFSLSVEFGDLSSVGGQRGQQE